MATARRRDEWDRMGLIMSLIYNRTIWGEKDKPVNASDFWPKELITDDDRKAQQKSIPRIKDGKELATMFGL